MTPILSTLGVVVVAVSVVVGIAKAAAGRGVTIPCLRLLVVAVLTALAAVVLSAVSALVVVAGVVAAVVVMARARRRQQQVASKASKAQRSGEPETRPGPEPPPDFWLVQRIAEEWPEACVAAGLVVSDADRTVAWQNARRAPGGHVIEQAVTVAGSRIAQRKMLSTPGVIVQGQRVLRYPVICDVRPADVGPVLTVQSGEFNLDHFRNSSVALASALRVPELSFQQSSEQIRQGVLDVEIVVRDAFEGQRFTRDRPSIKGRDPIVIARSRGGDVTWDPFQAAHVGLQGMTRSGKSEASYGLLSGLAGRPEVMVTGVDPSRVLLSPWQRYPGAHLRSVGTDPAGASEALFGLVALMDERLGQLDAEGIDKFEDFSVERPLVIVVLEEFPSLVRSAATADRALKPAERAAPRIEMAKDRLLGEGAKVGFRVVMISQRFDASLVGGYARSQFGLRITLRMDNAEGVRMLHDGISSQDVESAFDFPNGRALVQEPGMGRRIVQMDRTPYEDYRKHVLACSPVDLEKSNE